MRMSSPDHHKITGCVRNESQTKKVPARFWSVPAWFCSVPAWFWWVHVLVTAITPLQTASRQLQSSDDANNKAQVVSQRKTIISSTMVRIMKIRGIQGYVFAEAGERIPPG